MAGQGRPRFNQGIIRDSAWAQLTADMTGEEAYQFKIKQGPTHPCACCGGLFIIVNITRYTIAELLAKGLTPAFINRSCPKRVQGSTEIQLCSTCVHHVVEKKELPDLCLVTCPFAEIPEALQVLTPLEERFVAVNIPFTQIRSLYQYPGLFSSAVNVPIEMMPKARTLPRKMNQLEIIQVELVGTPENDQPVNPGSLETMLQNYDDTDANPPKQYPPMNERAYNVISDPDTEYRCYPMNYSTGGRDRSVPDTVSYSDLCKYEVRHFERRIGTNQLLFKAAKLYALNNNVPVGICLRQFDGRENLTAANMLDEKVVEQLIKDDKGYKVLCRNRHDDPTFWKDRKEDLLTMVRQLGRPTFNFTLSQAQTKWPQLIILLKKVLDKEVITAENVGGMPYEQKAALIRRDPVTCAQYFDNRVRALFALLASDESPFSTEHKLADFYLRVVFGADGSAQVRCLLWLDNAPKYLKNNKATHQRCIAFIDKLITCSSDAVTPDLLSHQIHKHTVECERRVDGRIGCGVGFPSPPMLETTILEPLEWQSKEMKKHLVDINTLLENLAKQEKQGRPIALTFEEMLTQLKCTKKEYLHAIRSSLDKPTTFLKRRPCEVMIAGYNANVLKLHQAKMDMQWILDPVTCADDLLSNNAEVVMSKLRHQIVSEMERGAGDHQRRLGQFAEKLLNSNEIAAEEAAYYCLGMAVARASRKIIFIDTSHPMERVLMVRPPEQLKQICENPQANQKDIFLNTYRDYYPARHTDLEDVTLAEIASEYEVQFPNGYLDEPDDSVLERGQHCAYENDDDFLDRQDNRQWPVTGFQVVHKKRVKHKVLRLKYYM